MDARTLSGGRAGAEILSDGRTDKAFPESVVPIFGDLDGKLDVLRVECTKCDRKGRYHVHKLIEKHGRMGNISVWVSNLKGDCPNRYAFAKHERCDLVCPDLSKML